MKFFLPLLILVFSSSLAVAQINPLSRTSEVFRTDGEGGNPSSFSTNQIQSTTFAPFDESLFPTTFSSVADQNSFFDNTAVTVFAELDNIGTSSFGSDFQQTFGSLSAGSTFELTFSIDNPSVFSVIGSLTEDDIIETQLGFDAGGAFFDLSGPSSLRLESDPFVSQTSINQLVTLLPGTYTLEVGAIGNANQIEPAADSSAQFTVEFVGTAVPEPSSLVLCGLAMPFVLMRRRRCD